MSRRLTAIVMAGSLVAASLTQPPSSARELQDPHPSQQERAANPRIDLAKIGHIWSKGRVQDNRLEVVERLIALGTSSIPYLMRQLEDERRVKGDVLDYWGKVTVGDIAFIILIDFFLDSSWEKSTIPGLGWKEFLEVKPAPVLTGEQQLRRYIAKHGRRGIKAKWQRIWRENKRLLYWDDVERCFKIKGS